MTFSARQFADFSDYSLLRTFLQQLPDMEIAHGNMSVGDLDWWTFRLDDLEELREVRLWFDDTTGRLAAFSWPRDEEIDLFSDPRVAGHEAIEAEMIAWC